jgi:hypothetical protein
MPAQLEGLSASSHTRRGPVPDHPTLGADERRRLFEHLLVVADACPANEEQLLRRQAVYLLAFDDDHQTRHWLTSEYTRAVRSAGHGDDIPSWVSLRSSAVALTRTDRDPLLAFITAGLRDEAQEIANLNYWAYWVGELGETQCDDAFMCNPAMDWDGGRLLNHLVGRLQPAAEQVELYVHTLWRLLLARPHLLNGHRTNTSLVAASVSTALDSVDLTQRARRELSDVAYAIRMVDR